MYVKATATVFENQKKTGYIVYPDQLAAFKAFVNSIPEGDMVFLRRNRAKDENSSGSLEISSFKPDAKQQPTPGAAAQAAAESGNCDTV